MKRILVFLCSVALVFSVAGIAGAIPTTWEDNANFNILIGRGDIFSYTLDIGDSGFVTGGDHYVEGYSLTVGLHDDGDGQGEIAFVNQPGLIADGFYNFQYVEQEFGWSIRGRTSLNNDGTLDVSIRSLWGDFYVDYLGVVARGNNGSLTNGDNGSPNGPAPVPEPSTILLLGAGLLGLVAVGRRKFNSKE